MNKFLISALLLAGLVAPALAQEAGQRTFATPEEAANHEAFMKKSKEKMHLVKVNDSLNTMVIGVENFPVPLPLVKKKQVWYFDGVLGLEEVGARRIGKRQTLPRL